MFRKLQKQFLCIVFVSFISSLFAQGNGEDIVENITDEPLLFFPDNRLGIQMDAYAYLRKTKEAEEYIASKQFLEAMQIYSQFYIDNSEDYAAIFGLANCYYHQGDYINAMSYYQQLKQNADFNDFDKLNVMRYHLATMYFFENEEEKFEQELLEIIDAVAFDIDPLKNIFINEGIDRIQFFYQLPFDTSFYAFRELGLYYLSQDRMGEGINYVLYAAAMLIQHINEYLEAEYPVYTYTDLRRTFELVQERRNSLEDLRLLEIERILQALYQYLTALDIQKVAYDTQYIFSLIEIFERDTDQIGDVFPYFPFFL